MTESENRSEVTEDGGNPEAPIARSGSGRTSGRRPVSILPWEAADPASAGTPPRAGRPPTRRAPVPPSGLVAAPGVGNRSGADDPFASLPPWLPPVRRPGPRAPFRPGDQGYRGGRGQGHAEHTGSHPIPPRTPLRTPPVPRRPAEAWPGQPAEPGPRRPAEPWLPAGERPSPPWAVPPPSAQAVDALADLEALVDPVITGRPDATTTAAPPKPATPKPTAPKPTPPHPATPKLTAPKPTAPRPTAPELAANRTAAPDRPAAVEQSEPAADSAPAAVPTTERPAPALPLPAPAEPTPKRRLTADAISHERIVAPDQRVPTVGWRAALYSATGRRVNLGVGAAEREWLELLARVRRRTSGATQLAVTSIKGGVGKTTVAACLGLMLAEYRGDGVVAVDADPDAGTLADRLSGEATVTVRDLLANLDSVKSLSQFGEYTSLAGRLRVLAGEQDPAMGEAFRREEYQRVCRALARFFDIVITDSGTGLVHSTMRGTLELADRLIVVGSPTVDGASRASKTLDWLLAHGHERLAEESVLVLCQDRGSHRVDTAQLYQHFAERCRHVVEIPADPHLYSGGLIEPSLLAPATRAAYLRLAAVVADGFSG